MKQIDYSISIESYIENKGMIKGCLLFGSTNPYSALLRVPFEATRSYVKTGDWNVYVPGCSYSGQLLDDVNDAIKDAFKSVLKCRQKRKRK